MSSTERTSAPLARELWIPALLALLVAFRWLLGERHSVYGDEAFHLTNLIDGVAAAKGGLLERLRTLYLFNFAYPPVFHLLSAPFVLPAADPVLGGRVYTQVLTLLVSLTLYSVTRQIGGIFAGTVAVLTLLATPSFVDVSRHYLLEPLLTLEVLLIVYIIGRYYEEPRSWHLVGLAALISAGLLTKFNFFFYAAPLFIVPGAIEIYRLVKGQRRWVSEVGVAAALIVAPLIVAGPWYVARATGSTSMLSSLYEAGTLKAGLSFELFVVLATGWVTLNFTLVFKLLALVAALLYVVHLVRMPRLRELLSPMLVSQHVVVSSALMGVLLVPIILALVGLGNEGRWHIETVYLLAVTFGILGRLATAPRLIALGIAALAAVSQLVTIYVAPVRVPSFLLLPMPDLNPLPSSVAVGSEELAQDIARHAKRMGGVKPGEFVYFFYHEHAGPHFGSVEFYLRYAGAPLATRIAGFYDRAIDVSSFFDAKYLVEGTGRSADWKDPENQRYKLLAQNLPAEFRAILVDVSDVDARFGRFKAFYVPQDRLTREMVLATIDTGRRLETVEPFLVIWDAQRIVWRAKFESLPANASLREEIDALLPRVPATEPKLSSWNRLTLQTYVARIQEIRKVVETAAPKPVEPPVKEPARRRRAA
jgi:dolichyl-phosphate-mannose-protein mannosyltransferase